jgi:hypothetical protein
MDVALREAELAGEVRDTARRTRSARASRAPRGLSPASCPCVPNIRTMYGILDGWRACQLYRQEPPLTGHPAQTMIVLNYVYSFHYSGHRHEPSPPPPPCRPRNHARCRDARIRADLAGAPGLDHRPYPPGAPPTCSRA